MRQGTVYLLHFDEPYQHARHYIGWALDLEERLREHRAGSGARLITVITHAGIGFKVARTWSGDRWLERRLKNGYHGPPVCPLCNPEHSRTRANWSTQTREGQSAPPSLIQEEVIPREDLFSEDDPFSDDDPFSEEHWAEIAHEVQFLEMLSSPSRQGAASEDPTPDDIALEARHG